MIEFTDEQTAFRSVVRDFARRELAPHVDQWEADAELPLEAVAAMAELGLFGIVFPAQWGGSDGDFTSLCIAIEEIGQVSQSLGITLSAAVGLGTNPIHSFGNDDQRAEWLPALVAGTALGAFGLTEPDAGSDAGGTRTRAVYDASTDEWVLNGSKAFITNSGTAITSIVTVTALTGSATDHPEISSFIVPTGTPGMTIEPAYRKLGWHASDTHGITLTDCRVPAANMLGAQGTGLKNFLAILDDGRIAISALAVGCAQACLDLAVDYAKERQAFGGAIGRFQGLAFQLSDLAVAVENSRNLTFGAARLKERGKPFRQAAAMAKLYSTETAVTATRVATQVFGGMGFMEESAVARFYRDAKILEIGEGTSEIQRLVIARGLGLPVG